YKDVWRRALYRLCPYASNLPHQACEALRQFDTVTGRFRALRGQASWDIIASHGTGISTMNRIPVALAVSVAGLCCAVAGCSTRTDVSVTGNTPAQYTHVWITAQEVWFNTSSIAGPDDGGWIKFPLSPPATVDLVTEA